MKRGSNKLLVINADDAGVHPHVDGCILTAARQGLLTSASVLANGATAREFIRAAADIGLGLGLHFNITEGQPLSSEVPGLTDSAGLFRSPKSDVWREACSGALDGMELREEARAQWHALISLGATLDHVDSHNHVHLYPCVLEALLEVLPGESPLHIRTPFETDCPEEVRPSFAAPHLEAESMTALIRDAGHVTTAHFIGFKFSYTQETEAIAALETDVVGACEWMVHPGARPGSPFTSSTKRDHERDFLLSADLKTTLAAWNVEAVRFGDLV